MYVLLWKKLPKISPHKLVGVQQGQGQGGGVKCLKLNFLTCFYLQMRLFER